MTDGRNSQLGNDYTDTGIADPSSVSKGGEYGFNLMGYTPCLPKSVPVSDYTSSWVYAQILDIVSQ